MIEKCGSFILFVVSVVLIFFKAEEGMARESPAYVRYSNEIVHVFSKEMEKEYGFRCVGDGGKMPYDVEEIDVDFIVYKKATIEEARILEVKATERLVKLINSHEKIRPFLREYPFKANRVKVCISFNKSDNVWYADGSVAVVFQARGKLLFRQAQPVTQDLLPLHDETYETALKIVSESIKKEDFPGRK